MLGLGLDTGLRSPQTQPRSGGWDLGCDSELLAMLGGLSSAQCGRGAVPKKGGTWPCWHQGSPPADSAPPGPRHVQDRSAEMG